MYETPTIEHDYIRYYCNNCKMFITVKSCLFRLDLIMSNTAQQFTTRLPKCFFIDSKVSFKFEKDSFDFDTFKFNATDYHCKFVIDFWNS